MIILLFLLFALTSCTSTQKEWHANNPSQTYHAERPSQTKPSFSEPRSVSGAKPHFYQRGMASYYASSFEGNKTASGEKYDPDLFTAASKTLPFNTMVLVKSRQTGRSVVVRINDRGPYSKKRVIDLSKAAAKKLGIIQSGVAEVSIYLLE